MKVVGNIVLALLVGLLVLASFSGMAMAQETEECYPVPPGGCPTIPPTVMPPPPPPPPPPPGAPPPPPAPPTELAETGLPVAGMAAVAGLAATGGSVLVLATRRRRRS